MQRILHNGIGKESVSDNIEVGLPTEVMTSIGDVAIFDFEQQEIEIFLNIICVEYLEQ